MDVIGFYGKDREYGVFSNFYPCKFEIGGKTFYWSEQYLMYQKALLFKDFEIAEQILHVSAPIEAKRLGRQVSNFDAVIWEQKCEDLFFPGLYAKFAYNQDWRSYLLSTGDAILCECSPRDRIWGIGMGKSDGRYKNPVNWKGKNRQGNMLMRVRVKLQEDFPDEYNEILARVKNEKQQKVDEYLSEAIAYFKVTGLYDNTLLQLNPQERTEKKQEFIASLFNVFSDSAFEDLRNGVNRDSLISLLSVLFEGIETYGILSDTTDHMFAALYVYYRQWSMTK